MTYPVGPCAIGEGIHSVLISLDPVELPEQRDEQGISTSETQLKNKTYRNRAFLRIFLKYCLVSGGA